MDHSQSHVPPPKRDSKPLPRNLLNNGKILEKGQLEAQSNDGSSTKVSNKVLGTCYTNTIVKNGRLVNSINILTQVNEDLQKENQHLTSLLVSNNVAFSNKENEDDVDIEKLAMPYGQDTKSRINWYTNLKEKYRDATAEIRKLKDDIKGLGAIIDQKRLSELSLERNTELDATSKDLSTSSNTLAITSKDSPLSGHKMARKCLSDSETNDTVTINIKRDKISQTNRHDHLKYWNGIANKECDHCKKIQLKALEQKIKQQEKEKNDAIQSAIEANTRAANLARDLEECKKRQDEKKLQFTNAGLEKIKLEASCKKLKDKNQQLNDTYQKELKYTRTLKGNIESLNKEITSMTTRMEVLARDHEELTDKHSTLVTAHGRLNFQHGDLELEKGKLERKVTLLTTKRTVLNEEIESIKVEYANLTRANADLTQTNTDLTRANADLTQTNTDLKRANTDLAKTNTDLKRANTDLTKTNMGLSKKNAGLTRTNVGLAKRNESIQQQMETLAQENVLIKSQISTLSSELITPGSPRDPLPVEPDVEKDSDKVECFENQQAEYKSENQTSDIKHDLAPENHVSFIESENITDNECTEDSEETEVDFLKKQLDSTYKENLNYYNYSVTVYNELNAIIDKYNKLWTEFNDCKTNCMVQQYEIDSLNRNASSLQENIVHLMFEKAQGIATIRHWTEENVKLQDKITNLQGLLGVTPSETSSTTPKSSLPTCSVSSSSASDMVIFTNTQTLGQNENKTPRSRGKQDCSDTTHSQSRSHSNSVDNDEIPHCDEDSELVDLRNRTSWLNFEVSRLTNLLDAANSEIESLKSESNNEKLKVAHLKSENDILLKGSESNMDRLAILENEFLTLQKEKETLDSLVASLTNSEPIFQKDIEQRLFLESDLESIRCENAKMKIITDKFRQNVESLQESNSNLSTQVTTLVAENNVLVSRIEQMAAETALSDPLGLGYITRQVSTSTCAIYEYLTRATTTTSEPFIETEGTNADYSSSEFLRPLFPL
ncbi:hypothetical protein BdWA1_002638 [Babesia duncani]|uniref:Uncharacterized protein n=1 Tax=Babesia duncani TaxID=323732 RepID=A0AAD9PJK4_9APIC|nr:hypothetical protein BdWA1_002638 [Babesia duncani]